MLSFVILIGLALPAHGANESAQNAVKEPIRDKWALIVGISKFKQSELDLKYPAKDARDFATFLLTEGNFEKDHVKVLTDEQATRERILDALGDKWLPRVAAPGDLVVIYLSTHGSPSEMDVGGVNYIVAHDTDKDRLYSTGIAMQDLVNIVKSRVHSDRALIIMDACHSGATTAGGGKGLYRPSNVDAEAIAQGTGQMVICSSSPSQLSWESKSAQNSVFTKRLIEGMKVKGSETTVGDTFQFLKQKVEEDVLRERGQLQSPQLKSKWEGDDLRLTVKPVDPRPGIPFVEESPKPVVKTPSVTTPSAATPPRTVIASNLPAQSAGVSTAIRSVNPSALPLNVSDAQLAEKALRDHFARMAYGSPEAAYSDLTANIKRVTPFERYRINLRKQKYVPAVADMPKEAFKHISANSTNAVILVNEKWITGENLLWRYSLVKQNGVWLLDGFRKITPAEW
jgi:hypothetical protein